MFEALFFHELAAMPCARSSSYCTIRISHEQVKSPEEVNDFNTASQELVDIVHICNMAHRVDWLQTRAERFELAAEFNEQVVEINIAGW